MTIEQPRAVHAACPLIVDLWTMRGLLLGLVVASGGYVARSAEPARSVLPRPGLFVPLTEPPCSYCSTEHRKGLIHDDDLVLAWIRGAHNGGAIPVRHFLAGPRVINDTYGLFFYDP